MKKITKIVAVSAIASALFLTGCSKSKSTLMNEYFTACQGTDKEAIKTTVKPILAKLEGKDLSADEEDFLNECSNLINMDEGEERAKKIAELKARLDNGCAKVEVKEEAAE